MDQELKQRLIGASVIIALAIIFVPMLFDGEVENKSNQNISISIPEAGENNLEVKKFELDKPVVSSKELPPSDAELVITEQAPQLVTTESANVVETTVAENNNGVITTERQTEPTQKPIQVDEQVDETVDNETVVNEVAAEPVLEKKPVSKPVTKAVVQPVTKPVALNQVYRVKLGSFSQQANAERVKSALLQKNIKAIVEFNAGLKLYRVWSQEIYNDENKSNEYVAAVNRLNLNIGTPKVIKLSAAEVSQMASQGQMGWVVQLGSFSAQENAIKLRNKVKAAGFAGFVDRITNSQGKTLYRLRIGPLMERVDAENTQVSIKQKLKLDGLIKPHEIGQVVN
ncbi:SPOR domain-containing protein [Marinicella sp. S1101]|uniref:SPOR domain-containing protein n=1 Tax=Marinicella marina TaxID=2996016 RepID=UPI002260C35F|nr:SPOR domain-containing protein [Marinicella marina]MCX7553779.1 SPOR domain-containing protein [Marinicella marina]MDJ1140854.1 SPOR domain-containing protein [Marinicella marina]